jgi:flagellar basal body-associated protein FliL
MVKSVICLLLSDLSNKVEVRHHFIKSDKTLCLVIVIIIVIVIVIVIVIIQISFLWSQSDALSGFHLALLLINHQVFKVGSDKAN